MDSRRALSGGAGVARVNPRACPPLTPELRRVNLNLLSRADIRMELVLPTPVSAKPYSCGAVLLALRGGTDARPCGRGSLQSLAPGKVQISLVFPRIRIHPKDDQESPHGGGRRQ